MIGHRDRYREGGPMDDVAANIRADQQEAPDPNPNIECAGECGERYPFNEYWQPRYVEPDDVDAHEAEWLCDDCAEVKRRTEANRDLAAFVGDGR